MNSLNLKEAQVIVERLPDSLVSVLQNQSFDLFRRLPSCLILSANASRRLGQEDHRVIVDQGQILEACQLAPVPSLVTRKEEPPLDFTWFVCGAKGNRREVRVALSEKFIGALGQQADKLMDEADELFRLKASHRGRAIPPEIWSRGYLLDSEVSKRLGMTLTQVISSADALEEVLNQEYPDPVSAARQMGILFEKRGGVFTRLLHYDREAFFDYFSDLE